MANNLAKEAEKAAKRALKPALQKLRRVVGVQIVAFLRLQGGVENLDPATISALGEFLGASWFDGDLRYAEIDDLLAAQHVMGLPLSSVTVG